MFVSFVVCFCLHLPYLEKSSSVWAHGYSKYGIVNITWQLDDPHFSGQRSFPPKYIYFSHRIISVCMAHFSTSFKLVVNIVHQSWSSSFRKLTQNTPKLVLKTFGCELYLAIYSALRALISTCSATLRRSRTCLHITFVSILHHSSIVSSTNNFSMMFT